MWACQHVFEIGLNSVENSNQSPTLLNSVFFMDSGKALVTLVSQLMTTFHLINWQLKTHATTNFCVPNPPVHHQRVDEKLKNQRRAHKLSS